MVIRSNTYAATQTQYSGSFLYPACITFVKLSILMQYRRLFSHHSRNFHWQINVLITIVAVWGAGIILTAFFLCVPMEKNWHPMVKGTCIPILPFYYALTFPVSFVLNWFDANNRHPTGTGLIVKAWK